MFESKWDFSTLLSLLERLLCLVLTKRTLTVRNKGVIICAMLKSNILLGIDACQGHSFRKDFLARGQILQTSPSFSLRNSNLCASGVSRKAESKHLLELLPVPPRPTTASGCNSTVSPFQPQCGLDSHEAVSVCKALFMVRDGRYPERVRA